MFHVEHALALTAEAADVMLVSHCLDLSCRNYPN